MENSNFVSQRCKVSSSLVLCFVIFQFSLHHVNSSVLFLPPSILSSPSSSFSSLTSSLLPLVLFYSSVLLLLTLKDPPGSRPPLRHTDLHSSSLLRRPSTSSLHLPSSTSFPTDHSYHHQPRHPAPSAPAPPPQHLTLQTSRALSSGLSSWGHSGNLLALHLHLHHLHHLISLFL